MTYHFFTRVLLAGLVAGLLALVYWVASQTLLVDLGPSDNVPEWSSISLSQPAAPPVDPETRPALKDETLLQPMEQSALPEGSAEVATAATPMTPSADAPALAPLTPALPTASAPATPLPAAR